MRKTKAILLIGGSGFLGTQLALRLRENYKVIATYQSNPISIPGVTYVPLNVLNRNWAKRILGTFAPEIMIYAAGTNDVEWTERHPRDAERLHTSGPATVLNVADAAQMKFIYLSNCYAFDGHRGNYHETDVVLPGYALGKLKISGENFIRSKSLNYNIVRLSPIFGRGNGVGMTFLDKLRMALDRGQRLELPVTEMHSFLASESFVDFIERLVESGPRNKILHFGGLTKMTHFEFGRAFAKAFDYDPELVLQKPKPKTHERLGTEIPTLDFSLNSTLVASSLKIQPLLIEQGFDLLKKSLITGL